MKFELAVKTYLLNSCCFSTWNSLFMLLVFYDTITIPEQPGLLKQFAGNSLNWLLPNFPLAYFPQAKQMWNQLSSEQKKTYGEDYYEAAMTSVEKYSRQVRVHPP